MHTIEITETREVEITHIQAFCGVRYWEDAIVNGEEDTDGKLIPFRDGDTWQILIELETGRIVGWPKGTVASVHYKVCDEGVYKLLREHKHGPEIVKVIDGYVPDIMSPSGDSFGDYVIMDIDENGFIANWRVTLEEFERASE